MPGTELQVPATMSVTASNTVTALSKHLILDGPPLSCETRRFVQTDRKLVGRQRLFAALRLGRDAGRKLVFRLIRVHATRDTDGYVQDGLCMGYGEGRRE